MSRLQDTEETQSGHREKDGHRGGGKRGHDEWRGSAGLMAQGQVTGWPPTSSHRHPETPTHPPGSRLTPPIREGKRKALKFNYSPVHERVKLAPACARREGAEVQGDGGGALLRGEVYRPGAASTALASPPSEKGWNRPGASQADGQGQR